MTLIYVSGELLDLYPDTVIAITFQSIDLGDLTARYVNYTNQVIIPQSEQNQRLFGFPQLEQAQSEKPYRLLECRVVQEGIEILVGVVYIASVEKNKFKIQIYESFFDYLKEAGERKIKDIRPLPVTEWDASAIDLYRNNIADIMTAVLWWGKPGSIYDANFFLPSFYYHTIIRNILQSTGLSLSGNILTNTDFTELVVPFMGDSFEGVPAITQPAPAWIDKGSVGTAASGTDVTATPSEGLVGDLLILVAMTQATGGSINTPDGWTLLGADTFNDSSPAAAGVAGVWSRVQQEGDGAFTVTRSGSTGSFSCQVYRFRGSANIAIDSLTIKADGNGSSTITFSAVTVTSTKRTLLALVAQLDSSTSTAPLGYSQVAQDTVDSGGIQIALELNVKENVASDGAVTSIGGSVNGWITFHLSIYNNDVNTIDWNDYLPDMEAKNFLRDFFIRFAVIPKIKRNTLYLKTLEEICTDRAGAIDWSGKLVNVDDKKIKFDAGYAQNNYFDFTDSVNDQNIGRGNLTVDNRTLELNKNYFKTIFENCKTAIFGDFNFLAQLLVYDGTSTRITELSDEPGLKLLTLRDRDSAEPGITFDTDERLDYKVAYFVDENRAKQTSFDYFLTQHYPTFKAALQRNKSTTKQFNLTVKDVYNYDPHKMIWDGEGFYLVNKISKFVPGELTTVELFKVS